MCASCQQRVGVADLRGALGLVVARVLLRVKQVVDEEQERAEHERGGGRLAVEADVRKRASRCQDYQMPPVERVPAPPASARAEPEGALVLLHGRGTDEHDLFPLIDLLDPEARLVGVTPRGPLSLPPGGAHWYVVREVGYPDPDTFYRPTRRSTAGSTRSLRPSACRPERSSSAASRRAR